MQNQQQHITKAVYNKLPRCRFCRCAIAPFVTDPLIDECGMVIGLGWREWCDCLDCFFEIRDTCECGENNCLVNK